jgi:hypothetical protein
MECYKCGVPARGVCVDCGVGLCADHGEFVEGHRVLRTGNLMQTRKVAARWFVCSADARARRASDNLVDQRR